VARGSDPLVFGVVGREFLVAVHDACVVDVVVDGDGDGPYTR
jgi:hypothetical protein